MRPFFQIESPCFKQRRISCWRRFRIRGKEQKRLWSWRREMRRDSSRDFECKKSSREGSRNRGSSSWRSRENEKGLSSRDWKRFSSREVWSIRKPEWRDMRTRQCKRPSRITCERSIGESMIWFKWKKEESPGVWIGLSKSESSRRRSTTWISLTRKRKRSNISIRTFRRWKSWRKKCSTDWRTRRPLSRRLTNSLKRLFSNLRTAISPGSRFTKTGQRLTLALNDRVRFQSRRGWIKRATITLRLLKNNNY